MANSSGLRQRAADAATTRTDPPTGPDTQPPLPGVHTPAELPDVVYDAPIDDAEVVPVVVAWARVMKDVTSIGKGSLLSAPGVGTFRYRGVDEVFNAVGPALRRHGVVILPTRVAAEYRDTRTSKGNAMRECTATVDYAIVGPGGDRIEGQSRGEATDTLDKGTTKALSVAYRNFLLQALCVPTNLPDPEASTLERGERPTPRAADYVDEIAHPRTSATRLRQIHKELKTHNLLGVLVTNETGDEEAVGVMVTRIGAERAATEQPGGES